MIQRNKRVNNIIKFIEKFKVADVTHIQRMFYTHYANQEHAVINARTKLRGLVKDKTLKRNRNHMNMKYYYYTKPCRQVDHCLLLTELFVRLCEIYGHSNVDITPEYTLKNGKRPDGFLTIKKGGRLYLYYVEIHISNNKFNISKYEQIYSDKLQEFPTLIIVTDQKLKLQTKLDHVIIGKDMQNIKSKVRVNSGIVGR